MPDWRTKNKSNWNSHIVARFLLNSGCGWKQKLQEYDSNESRSKQLHNCCHCNQLTTAHLMKNSGYVTVARVELTNYAQINSTANYSTEKKATTPERAGQLIEQDVGLPSALTSTVSKPILLYAVWHVLTPIQGSLTWTASKLWEF